MGVSLLSEKLREAVNNWEKEADQLVKETMKVGEAASEDLRKQLSQALIEVQKLLKSIREESTKPDEQLKKALDDLEVRTKEVQDKLNRAWNELKK